MIVIFTSEYEHYGTWLNFRHLVSDIKHKDKPEWSFEHLKPVKVRTLYESMKDSPVKENLREAYEQNLGVLDICAGEDRSLNPLFIPVTDDLDIKDLKRSWCFDYFKAKGFRIFENIDIGTFEKDIASGLGKSLEYLEWIPNKEEITNMSPYVLLIRIPYPPSSRRVARIVNNWRNRIMVEELI